MIRRDTRRFNALVTELAVPIPDVFMKEIWRKGSRTAVRHPAAGLLYKRGCYRCCYAVMCNPKPRNIPLETYIATKAKKDVDRDSGVLYIAGTVGGGSFK